MKQTVVTRNPEQFYTIKQAAALLDVHRGVVGTLVEGHGLAYQRTQLNGNAKMLSWEQIEYLKSVIRPKAAAR